MLGKHAPRPATALALFLLCSLGSLSSPPGTWAQVTPTEDFFRHMEWRQIGPAVFGGRMPDVEAVPDNPAVMYVAGSTGGIFKTTNHGVTWEPIFDEAGPTLSIGDMALAPSDPLILWVGTGESNGEQQAAALGNGVYRSLDGGRSWEHMGLEGTRFINRVVVHPTNPDIVFVAATGHRWGPNEERGLYRTLDGGRSWQKILYINDDTGITEVAMEDNGRVLYAAAWQRRRHAWGNLTGGPHSGIYRSMDGGDTWEKLGGGLPEGVLGKIAMGIAKSRPNVVYAAIGDEDGGFYRSQDRGDTWTRVNDIRTSYWYGNIYVDPVNENKVWVMGTRLAVSIDGGKNFENDWTARDIHVDHHAIWINPENPDHMIMGNDGGFHITWDGARTWSFLNNIPVAQYYTVEVDHRDPYHVYGGLQDNGTWGIPSRTYSRGGIYNEDVVSVGGGDGFVPVIDPRDPKVVYTESQYAGLRRFDLVTLDSEGIKPTPEDTTETYRFNWNSPLLISPHDPDVIYLGGNKLFRTTDQGESWEEVSGDLTRNETPSEWEIMGLKPSLRPYNTLTAVAESPLRQGLIYTGADDGSVHRTTDGGETWEPLTGKFGFGEDVKFVTKIHASSTTPEVAYISFTGHYHDDFRPHLYKTEDAGESWRRITGDMPAEAVINAIVEHPDNPDLLLAGIHNGLMISRDGGESWIRADGNLPPVSVNGIRVKDGDLVLGTYGRGIVILDDAAFLARITDEILEADAHLFPIREAEQYYRNHRTPANRTARFAGPNPEYGALITYYLSQEGAASGSASNTPGISGTAGSSHRPGLSHTPGASGTPGASRTSGAFDTTGVSIEILDESGTVIRELQAPKRPGFNRMAWDLRRVEEPEEDEAGEEGQEREGQEEERERREELVDVEPGRYTVRLTVGGRSMTQAVTVIPDKRR